MAYLGSQPNTEFQSGLNHLTNPGRANENSVTLSGGLQQTAERWAGLTPHEVINTASGATPGDSSWEALQRQQGGYQPGTMEQMQDQLDQGTDNQ